MISERRLVSGVELARIVGVTADTIARWRRADLIPSVWINRRTIRFDPDDVIAALKQHADANREVADGGLR